MNATSYAAASVSLRSLLAAVLALALPLLAGCSNWSDHDLEGLALSTLTTPERQTLKAELAGLLIDDRSQAGMEKASAILTRVNPEAASSPAARAMQAAVVGRLFKSNVAEPEAAWLTPEAALELTSRLNEVFIQADERLRSPTPDLMTAMVWGQTGTALGKSEDIHELLALAKTNPKLKELIREDDPTRERLYRFATNTDRSDWWREVRGVVYRQHVPSPMEQFCDVATGVILLPVYAVVIVVWALHGAPVL